MSTALVTGGTGFIGIYVIKLLLKRGDRVHTTVRNVKDQKKCQPLLSLQNAYPGRLHLFQADLLKEGSFAQAMQGCDIVHHVASPFLVPQQIKDGMKDIVEPAIKGTQNVLNTANQTESVKRIVLTSSIAAMYGDSADILHYDNATLTESHWNTTSTATSSAYSYSKVAAEREAWKICHAQSRWDLIAINPGLVIGPSLTPQSASGSLHMLEAMYKGDNKMGAPELHYPIVDVREVAEAHVRAGVDAAAKGRYIVASERSRRQSGLYLAQLKSKIEAFDSESSELLHLLMRKGASVEWIKIPQCSKAMI
ncbi:cinnamoyl-CoA reductase [Aureobasidium pullulans]|nr:cinnamoyl-CoA reductase [Aureobasidium pullulans]